MYLSNYSNVLLDFDLNSLRKLFFLNYFSLYSINEAI